MNLAIHISLYEPEQWRLADDAELGSIVDDISIEIANGEREGTLIAEDEKVIGRWDAQTCLSPIERMPLTG